MQNDGNVDRALDALFASGGDLSQGGSQGTAPAAAPASPAITEALVSQLIDMGFTRDRAIHALEATVRNPST
jgi:UBA/TS-N domain